MQAVDGEVIDGEFVGDLSPDERRIVAAAASFSGPLPPPETLKRYDDVVPGLAAKIVDQWTSETAHRRATITAIRETDHAAMEAYYSSDQRGQTFAGLAFLGTLAIAALSIVLDRPIVGVAGVILSGGSAIWAMRRNSSTPQEQAPPTDLAKGDEVEDPAR
jgi:uncharacterized membrane protein